MAYDLIVGGEVPGDYSMSCCGEDEEDTLQALDERSGAFVWTGRYVPGRDAVDNIDASYPEQTRKAAVTRLHSLSAADMAMRRAWHASRRAPIKVTPPPASSSGHALSYDTLGRATIVDVPVGHHGGGHGGRGRGRGGRGGGGWGPAYYDDLYVDRRPIFIDPSKLPPGVQVVSGAGLLDVLAPGATAKMTKAGLPPEQVAAMQLAAGVPGIAVANMLSANGWSKDKVQEFLKSHGDDTDLVGSFVGSASPRATVLRMQAELASVGLPVKRTGKLDAATVDGLNSVFEGSDDAPVALRSGTLTGKQVAANLPLVARTLAKAVGSAKGFDQLEEG